MEMKEKMELIKLLTELHGVMIVNKLEGKDNTKNLRMLKEVARELEENDIGKFIFTCDEAFEISVSEFLSDFE